MNLPELFKQFLLSQKKKPSALTLKNYLADVNQFIRWYETTYSKAFHPSLLTADTIQSYQTATKASTASMKRYLSSLRKFSAFLQAQGYLATDPFAQLQTETNKQKTDPWNISEFKNQLKQTGASDLTIKNYISDLVGFINWAGQVTDLNEGKLASYQDHLRQTFSPASANRKLSSLRKYLTFASEKGLLESRGFSPDLISKGVKPLKEIEENKQAHPSLLTLENESEQTQTQGNLPAASSPKIKDLRPKTYSAFPPLRLLQKTHGLIMLAFDASLVALAAVAVEKLQYLSWLASGKQVFVKSANKVNALTDSKINGLISNSLFSELFNSLSQQHDNTSPKTQDPRSAAFGKQIPLGHKILSPLHPSHPDFKNLPVHHRILGHARYTRPAWYRTYHSYPITHYFHLAALVVIIMALTFGAYNALFADAQKNKSLAAPPTAPPRVLSFQGRLTDNSDNPIDSAKQLRFAIYNDQTASGSALLWQEVQTITPDVDGIFSAYLGNGTPIPASVFSQNSSLYLGVTVESDPELAPRQQIATVPYAANSETLQGLLPITAAGAGTTNVVLALDSSGNLTIGGSANPTFQASGGSFTLSGNVLNLTTEAGSNSDVVINPDGLGRIDLNKPLQNTSLNNNIDTAAGAVEVDDMFAVLATSSGQSAFTLNQNGSGPIFSASSSGTAKFSIDSLGVITANNYGLGVAQFDASGILSSSALSLSGSLVSGTLPVTRGGTGLGSVTSGDLLYGSTGNTLAKLPIGTTGKVLTVSGGLPSWQDVSSLTGSAQWTLSGGTLYPNDLTTDVLIGGTSTASAKFAFINNNGTGTPTASISGNFSIKVPTGSNPSTSLNILNGGTFGIKTSTGNDDNLVERLSLLNNGNVGIGSTSPAQKLDVNGNVVIGGDLMLRGSTVSKTVLDQYGDDASGMGLLLGGGGATIIGAGESANTAQPNLAATTEQLWLTSDQNIEFISGLQSGWATGVRAMSITAAGNVGIGTTNPSTQFQVANNLAGTGVTFSQAVAQTPGSPLVNIDLQARGSFGLNLSGYDNDAVNLVSQMIDENSNVDFSATTTGANGVNGLTFYYRGNVGIGSTSPGYNLDVAGSANATTLYQAGNEVCDVSGNCAGTGGVIGGSGTLNYLAKFSPDGNNIADSILYDSGTAIGIGTTSPAGNFEIHGTAADLRLGDISGTNTALRLLGSNADDYSYIQAGQGSSDTTANLRITRMTTGSTNIANFQVYADKTFFNGNVGIGTTATDSIFETAGTITIKPTSGDALLNLVAGTGRIQLNGNNIISANSGATTIGVNGNEKARFDSNGNLGIGTTAPGARLDVVSTGSTTNGLNLTANGLTSGYAANLSSTSTGLTTGGLLNLDWSPTSATTATGDLFSLNVGANGTIGNLFNIKDNGSSIFSVSQANVTANIPAQFNAAGDVSIAYDLNFTNATSSNIKSSAPLSITAGEAFNSSNLELKTYNEGNVVVDSQALQVNQAATVSGTLTLPTLNTAGGVLYADGTGLVSQTGAGTNTQCLLGGTTPTWGACSAGGGITGTGTLNYLAKFTASGEIGDSLIYDNGTTVGIGTTNPQDTFQVSGGNILLDNGQSLAFMDNTATERYALAYTTSNNLQLENTAATGSLQIGNGNDAGSIQFYTGSAFNEAMRIDALGNVGIGSTSPTAKLDVGGNINIQGYATASASLAVGYTSAPAGVGNAVFSGNVGIGTTNPLDKLDLLGSAIIRGDVNDDTSLTINRFGGAQIITMGESADAGVATFGYSGLSNARVFINGGAGGGQPYIRTYNTSGTVTNHIVASGDSYFNGGNIGIGTTTPTAKLDVAGDASLSGSLVFNSASTQSIDVLNGKSLNFNTSDGGDTGLATRVSITSNGRVGIGNTNPQAMLHSYSNADMTATSALQAGRFELIMDADSGNSTHYATALSGGLRIDTDSLVPLTDLDAGYNNVSSSPTITGDGTIDDIAGFNSRGILYGGTLSSYELYRAVKPNDGSGGTAAITNLYGYYVGNLSGGFVTNAYGIYQAGASDKNYFAGNVGIGSTSPNYKLDVNGSANVGSFYLAGSQVTSSATELNYLDGTTVTAGGVIYGDGTKLANAGAGTSGNCLISGGAGAPTWGACSTGSVTGSGTANYLPKWNGTSSLTDSLLYDNGTNVAIGTTSPDTKFHIYGTSGNLFQVGNNNNVVGNRVIITASGDIEHTYGLNNGSATSNHGRFLLTSNVSSRFDSSNDSGGLVLRNNTGDWSGVIGDSSTTGGLKFLVGGTSTNQAYDAYTGTEAMRITEDGNIGIGTTIPVAKLDVEASGTGTDLVSQIRNYDSAGVSQLSLQRALGTVSSPLPIDTSRQLGQLNFKGYDGSGFIAAAAVMGGSENAFSAGSGNGYLAFQTRSGTTLAEQMRITSTGNVGIGTTIPGTDLAISGSTAGSAGVIINTPSTSTGYGAAAALQFNYGGGSSLTTNRIARITAVTQSGGGGDLYFENAPSASGAFATNMVILRNGNVGIGTTNPAQLFTVGSGSPFQINSTGDTKAPTLALGIAGIAPTDRVLYSSISQPVTSGSTYNTVINTTKTGTLAANTSSFGFYNNVTNNATDGLFSHNVYGSYNLVSLSDGNTVDNQYGVYSQAQNNSTTLSPDTANTASTSAAFRGLAFNNAAGTVTNQYGGWFDSYNNSTGSIANAYGTFTRAYANAGTITNGYGLYAQAFNNGGTITNAYGVYIGNNTGTNSFGLYQSSSDDLNYFAGNVGIGTTNPQAPLDVTGDIYLTSGLSTYRTAVSDGTIEAAKFCTGDGETNCVTDFSAITAGAVSFADITSGTNTAAAMVIGTGSSLTYSGSGTINASSLNSLTSGQFLRSDTSDNYTAGTLAFNSGTTLDVNGDLAIADTDIALDGASTNLTTTGNFSINSSQLFVNKASGNIGIGTTNPGKKLQIYDAVNTVEALGITYDSNYTFLSSGKGVQLSSTSQTFNSTGFTNINATNQLWLKAGSNIYFQRKSDNADLMTILTANGNVGIGSTAPGQKLDVTGNIRSSGQFLAANGTAAAPAFTFTSDNNTGMFNAGANLIGFSTGGAERMRLDASGNLGIGSTSPSQKLDVNGAINQTGGIYYNSSPMNVELTRTVPTTVNDYVEIGSLNLNAGAHNVRLSVTVSDSAFSVAKTYVIPIYYNQTNNVYQVAQAISDTGSYSGNDFAVDVNVSNFVATFRLRRTSGATTGTARIRLESTGSKSDVFTALTGTGSVAAPTSTLATTSLTQTDGNVGINTASPAYTLDVNGSTNTTSLYLSGSQLTSSATELNYLDGTTVTAGGVLYGDGTKIANSGVGTSGQCLMSGAAGAPTWGDCSTGSITGGGTLNYIPKFSPDGTTLTDSLLFDDGTNVGIGTTVPGSLFQLTHATVPGTGADTRGITIENTAANSLTGQKYSIDTGVVGVNDAYFGIQDVTNNAYRMVIKNDGNIGIGTTNPGAKLDVAGQIITDSTGLCIASCGVQLSRSSNDFLLTVTNAANMRFSTNNSERMRIDSAGNVGIGTTIPGAKLQVVPTSGAALSLGRVSGQPTIKSSTDWLIMDSNTNPAAINYYVNQNVILANGGGNVAVGGTTAAEKLDVNGSIVVRDTTGVRGIRRPDAGYNLNLLGGDTLTTGAYLSLNGGTRGGAGSFLRGRIEFSTGSSNETTQADVLGDYAFMTQWNGGSATLMTIDSSSGNVGIGSTTPGALLDVAGTAKISGVITLSNYTTAGGLLYTDGSGVIAQTGAGTASQCLLGGAGTPTWGACSTGSITGGGTLNYLPKFSPDGTTLADSLLFDDGTNVGIGTSAPDHTLTVYNSAADAYMEISGHANGNAGIIFTRADNGGEYGRISTGLVNSNNFTIEALGTKSITFVTRNGIQPTSEKMRLTADGNLGIGTTAPTGLLDVDGASIGKALAVLNQTGDQAIFTASQSGTTKFIIDNGGNVGIGTTSPAAALHVVGNITSPGAGALSEKFGYGAGAAGDYSVAFGYDASASTNNTVAIGYSAAAYGTNGESVAIGYNADASVRSVALGYGTVASGSYSTAIGRGAQGTSDYAVAIGGIGAHAGYLATALNNAQATGSQSIAIGYGATAGYTNSMTFGRDADATAANQLVFKNIYDVYFGSGVSDAAPADATINGAGASGTDIAGANLTLAGGQGTGAGAGGALIFKTAAAGATGATLNALTERMRITSNGNVGIGTTAPDDQLQLGTGFPMYLNGTNGEIAVVGNMNLIIDADNNSSGAVFRIMKDARWAKGGTPTELFRVSENGSIITQANSAIDTNAAGTLTIGGTTQTGLTLGRTGAATSLKGSNITNGGIAYGASNTLSFTGVGTSGQCLMSGGAGTPTWGACSTGSITGSGTLNYLAKFTGTGSIGISQLFDNGTNVGIGSTTPGAKLDVNGSVNINNNITIGNQIIGGFGAMTTSGVLDWNDSSNARSGNGYTLLTGSATNGPSAAGGQYFHPFNFEYSTKDGTGNLTQLAIPYGAATSIDQGIYMRGRYSGTWSNWVKIISENTSGNVGIGSTSPGQKLDVVGNARVSGQYLAANGAVSAPAYSFTSDTNMGIYRAGTDILGFATSGAERMRIDASGNTGIGTTTTSSYKFNVGGDIYATNNLVADGGTGTTTITGNNITINPGRSWQINTSSTLFSLKDNSAGQDRLDIDTSGNIGIGSTAPAAKVDIVSTGTTTNGLNIAANSLTTGFAANLSSTSTGLTTGGLLNLDWSPGSATTATGDLFSINVGANGTVGNIFNLKDNGSSVFSVSQANVSANVPAQFNAAGDVSIAYDLNFTNATSSNIKSSAPLAITAGEAFNSSNLTLKTYNAGNVVVDSQALSLTGSATVSGELTLSSKTTAGGILYTDGTGLVSQTGAGTNTQCLIGGTTPTWGACSTGGGVTGTGTLNYLPKWGSSSSLTDSLLYDNGTNVGIGTSSPIYALDVLSSGGSVGRFRSSGVNNANLVIDNAAGGQQSALIFSDAGVGKFQLGKQTNNTFFLYDITNGRSTFLYDPTANVLDLQATSGNVGIGTGTAGQKLDVAGSIQSSGQFLAANGTAAAPSYSFTSDTNTGIFHAGENILSFATGASERMRIYSNGNVGIHNTAPSKTLDVSGDIRASGGLFASTAAGDPGGTGLYLQYAGSTPNSGPAVRWSDGTLTNTAGLYISGGLNYQGNSGNPDFQIRIPTTDGTLGTQVIELGGSSTSANSWFNAGNVGIGTTNPVYKLDVRSSGTADTLQVMSTAASGQARIHLVAGTGGLGQIDNAVGDFYLTNAAATGSMLFRTNNTEAMRITSAGNVGIGSTSPDALLAVAGNVNIQGSVKQYFSGQETRTYRNVAQYNDDAANVTGTLKIVLPRTNTNTMLNLRISGYNYAANGGSWEVLLGGYNYSGGWTNTSADITGSAPFTSVRFGNDGTNDIILLGDTTTVWQYPQVFVDEVHAGYSNEDSWDGTWTLSLITDETGITVENTPLIKMYAAANGNVGIGTTAPSSKLDVNGTITAHNGDIVLATPGSYKVGANTIISSIRQVTAGDGSATNPGYSFDGSTEGMFKTGQDLGFSTSDTERLRIASNGNVGIGSIAPVYKLDVNGTGRFTGNLDANSGIDITSGDLTLGSGGQIDFADAAEDKLYLYSNTYGIGIESSTLTNWSGSQFRWRVGGTSVSTGTERMVLNSAGNLQIDGTLTADGTGTNTIAGALLQTGGYGTTGGNNDVVLGAGGVSPNAGSVSFGDNSGWKFNIGTNVASTFTPRLTVVDTGNVGIGSTSPGYKLDVAGSTNTDSLYLNGSQVTSSATELNILDGATLSTAELNYLDGTTVTAGGVMYGNGTFIANTGVGTAGNCLISGGAGAPTWGSCGSSGTVGGTGTTNYVAKWSSSTGLTDSVLYDDGTNIGIGSTTPTQILDINAAGANIKIRGNTASGTRGYLTQAGTATYLTHNAYFNGTSTDFTADSTAAGASSIQLDRGFIAFRTAGATLTSPITWTEGMRIDSTGNVGIGSTAPGAKLDVNGTVNISGALTLGTQATTTTQAVRADRSIISGNGLTGGGDLTADRTLAVGAGSCITVAADTVAVTSACVNAGTIDGLNSTQFLRSDTSDSYTAGTLTFNSGTTLSAASGSTVDVNGNLSVADTDIALDGTSTNFTTTGNFSINSSQLFINKVSGNVGIGTTAPGAKLEVVPSTGAALNLGRVSGQPSIKSSGDWLIMDSNTQPAALNYYTAQNVILAYGGGNVGIGTTTASQQLYVSGNTQTTGVYYAGNGAAGGPAYSFGSDTNTGMYSGGADILDFATAGALRMQVAANGNIGIANALSVGDTSVAAGKLFIRQSGTTNNDGLALFNSGGTASARWWIDGSGIQRLDNGSGATGVISLNGAGAGNVGIGTTTAPSKLTVNGNALIASNATINGVQFDPSLGSDQPIYFAPQPYFEAGNTTDAPFTVNVDGYTTVNDATVPFSKVALSNSYDQMYSDFIPVQPGDTIYGEMWAERDSGATGTAGVIYYGIERYDKDKLPIASNNGTDYMVASNVTVPSDGVWHMYSGQRTLPLTHTAYNGSDGGPVRYVRVRIYVNYSAGTIPTKWGGIILRRVAPYRDSGPFAVNGSFNAGGFQSTTDGSAAGPAYSFSSDTNIGMYRIGTDTLGFSTAGGERLRIASNGNVGVGTSSTTQKLTVNGNTYANNYYVAAGNGNGIGFWNGSPSTYGIFMGNSATYQYGDVTDYAMTYVMSSGTGRGFTWSYGGVPSMGLNASSGNLAIKGTFTANGTGVSTFAGNVGIGTTTAGYGLQVGAPAGTGAIATSKYFDIDNAAYYLDPAGSGTSLAVAGNVGIGTTNPIQALDVTGNGTISGSVSIGAAITGQKLYVAGNIQATGVMYAADGTATGPAFTFGADTNNGMYRITTDTLGFSTAGVERLRIASNGNIGVGTSTTSQKLYISGNTQTTGSFLSGNGSATLPGFAFGSDSNNGMFLAGADILAFSTGSAERLRIAADGNIGIGTTTATGILDVRSTATTIGAAPVIESAQDNTMLAFKNLSTGGATWWLASTGGTSGYGQGNFAIGTGTSFPGTPSFSILANGNVGIGSTSPGAKLDVSGGALFSGNVGIGTTSAGYPLTLATSNTGTAFQIQNTGTGCTVGSTCDWYFLATNSGNGVGYNKLVINDSNSTSNALMTFDSTNTRVDINGTLGITTGSGYTWHLWGRDSTASPNECDTGTSGTYHVFCFDSDEDSAAEFNIDSNGNTEADLISYASDFQTTFNDPDIAEYIPVSDMSIDQGDILAADNPEQAVNDLKGDSVTAAKSHGAYDSTVIGVVSTDPGFLIANDTVSTHASKDDPSPVIHGKWRAMAISGRIPTKVSTINGPIKVGDTITASSIPGFGMKATKAGQIVGRALQAFDGTGGDSQVIIPCPAGTPSGVVCGKVIMLLSVSWYDPDVYITDAGTLNITGTGSSVDEFKAWIGQYETDRKAAFSDAVIARLLTGLTHTTSLIVDGSAQFLGTIQAQAINAGSLAVNTISVGGQSLQDYILSVVQNAGFSKETGIVSPVDQLAAGVISPIDGQTLTVNGNLAIKKTASTSGSLSVDGNASISGTLTAKDATISGTLHAHKIQADEIEGLDAKIASLSANTVTATSAAITNITNITNIYQTASDSASQTASDSGSLTSPSASGSATASGSALLSDIVPSFTSSAIQTDYADIGSLSAALAYVPNLSSDFGTFNQGLISLGPTSLTDTTIAGQLAIGGSFILTDNSINTLGATLEIQPLRQGNLSFMAGLMTLDTDGNLMVGGNAVFAKNVTVKGTLAANIISPVPDSDLIIALPHRGSDATPSANLALRNDAASKIKIQNASGSAVLQLNEYGDVIASGAGAFANLQIIRGAQADTSFTTTVASGSAGTATIVNGETSRTIISPFVTKDSLIYITATSDTGGIVPFVARQTAEDKAHNIKGSFTIEIPQAVPYEIDVNWWIIN